MDRSLQLESIKDHFKINPVTAILGPRQCGKTTLARQYTNQFSSTEVSYFDLEDPRDLQRLENPMLSLEDKLGLIVIDEVQLAPDLFKVLRVLVDQKKDRQFLILGSASGELMRQSSESLAGRISYLELAAFSATEVGEASKLWLRGGFPDSYLAIDDQISKQWRMAYISTFLERDIPRLGIKIPANTLRRFWIMLTSYHGNLFNSSEIGKSLGIAHTTARSYLDILTGTFMLRELTPWYENIQKRQRKAPKVYFRDSGIFHALLGANSYSELEVHPKLGASWEGFALEEIIRFHNAGLGEVYYWNIHGQAELDLLIIKDGKRIGFEFKYAEAPKLTKSSKMALEYLNLDSLTIITPGKHSYKIEDKVVISGLVNYLGLPSF